MISAVIPAVAAPLTDVTYQGQTVPSCVVNPANVGKAIGTGSKNCAKSCFSIHGDATFCKAVCGYRATHPAARKACD